MTRLSQRERFTRLMITRALLKALCLFAAFNFIYGKIQPTENGLLPSLYNVVFTGRERLVKDYEFDPYRLVSDHIVSRATPDTFNIAILGSSEIWGSRTGPAESIPAYLDRLGMVAADGRPVRVYNLGYPYPYAYKDMAILEAVAKHHIPLDLVILSTFDTTLSLAFSPHRLSSSNLAFERSMIDHYGLPARYFGQESVQVNEIARTFLPVWNDRDALSVWATMQMRGLVWNVMDDDIDLSNQSSRYRAPLVEVLMPSLPLSRVNPENSMLGAFVQFEDETNIPIMILEAPVPAETNDFAPWLRDQAHAFGFPMIDCWDIYRVPNMFEDYYHIIRELHEPYARTLAKALSDSAFKEVVSGLPLDLPSDFVISPETCAVYAE